MELLKVAHVLTRGGKHNRFAGHRSNRKRRTAAGVTIKLGKHHTGEVHALVEGVRGIHRILADHRINHEQHFLRLNSITNITCLLHELSIHTQAASSINNHHVMQLRTRLSHTISGHLHRVTGGGVELTSHTRVRRKNRYTRAFTHNLQLGHRIRALQIRCYQDWGVPLTLQPLRQLTRQRGFTGTLQTSEHNNGGAALRHIDTASLPTQNTHQLLIDDLHDLLRGVQSLRHFRTKRTLLHMRNELTHHRNGDVRIQQRTPDLPHGRINISL